MSAVCVRVLAVCSLTLACLAAGLVAADEPAFDASKLPPPASVEIDFVRDIQPIFAQRCLACHGSEKQEGGLRLHRRAHAFAGGDQGIDIQPKQSAESRLIHFVSGLDPDTVMPPEGERLSAEQVGLLRAWIDQGAVWPEEADNAQARLTHWAWQKPVQPPLPQVNRADWPKNPLDYFVLARLEREGLSPVPEADRAILIRRLSLDLIGLPPTPAEVEAFVNDSAPDACERLVDRLLADPGYGERWARMWLDLARYADSKGYGSDPLRTIWRYRDWVIEAFNRNLPYDQFTIEQLAGDLLPNPTAEQILATAFHRNTMANDEGGTDDEEFRVAAVKDRIETTSQVWMGLTMGCAKCHTHKYDPITQREYYQFYAFFNQTEDADKGDEGPRVPTPTAAQLAEKARLAEEAVRLQAVIDDPALDLAAAQAQWEEATIAQERQWKTLVPSAITSAGGAAFEPLGDGSWLVTGASADADTYTIVAPAELENITAIRLEALPHESLPQGGPGRAPDGACALNDLRVTAAAASASPTAGRFVRVQIPGEKQTLSLAEVQVFRGTENLALAGQATQSTTGFEGHAKLAIDGNTSGDYFKDRSVTHNFLDNDPWWEVDLGQMTPVERIVLWNRTDNNLEHRLSNFRVSLLDDARQTVWQTAIADPPKPSLEIPVGGPAAVMFGAASADTAEPAAAIDADPATGWAVGAAPKPHVAVFQTKEPAGRGPTTLTITLTHAAGMKSIGRLRLSITAASPPPVALPGGISEILALASEARTPEMVAELARYYRTIAPVLAETRARLATVQRAATELETSFPTTPIMRELPQTARRETRVMLKGNFLSPGDAVEPTVLAAMHPLPTDAPADRLGVARWLMDRENPLTARVAVNRFWAQLFGTGLVETEEDFGTQGQRPSHPELLDWLAVEFSKTWDVKALLKLIVTSAGYRQSSTGAPELVERDPANRLLARGPRVRLEAEMVRDQALALAGLLSRKIGGPSVYPPQPDGLWRAAFNGERTWPTSMGEDRYRRGLYTYWRRTVPYPSMAAFDAPSREICTLRRTPTNTPLQAFVTLNDPVYVEAAQALARRIVREGGATVAERAAFGLSLCLARPAHARQIEEIVALHESELARYQSDSAGALTLATEPLGPLPEGMDPADLAAWTVVGNVLLNLDGVLTKR